MPKKRNMKLNLLAKIELKNILHFNRLKKSFQKLKALPFFSYY